MRLITSGIVTLALFIAIIVSLASWVCPVHAEQRTAYPPANAKTSAGPIFQGTAYPPGMSSGGGGLAIELVIGVNSLPLVS